MRLKDSSINLASMSVQLMFALVVIDHIYIRNGQELVITSLNDGRHMIKSLHYSGNAADLRTRYFTKEQTAQVAKEIKASLPSPDFDVVVETNHIHIEYQPKRR